MKKNILFKGLGLTMVAGSLFGCSSDYLDLAPETDVPTNQVTQSVDGMRSATYGLFGNMYRQYSSLYDNLWFNGEPWFSMVYGEVLGQDYISYFWISILNQIPNWEVMRMRNGWPNFNAWTYCYGLIGNANTLIAGTDNEEVLKNDEMKFRRAQCLTMRAHAYTRLLQVFGPRWTDSKNGEMLTLPLRLEPADTDTNCPCPLSSMGEVMDAIYADLDEAIALFESVPQMGRQNYWETDIDVAKGLYARAAMLKNDYATAQKMANEARKNYPIMSAEEWQQGFAAPNGEWMWCNQEGFAGIYYASFGATYACNGAYPTLWGNIGAGAMDVMLYNQLDRRDMRRALFFMPDKAGVFAGKDDFYKAKNCASASMNVNRGALARPLGDFIEKMYNQIGAPNGWLPPYTNPQTGSYAQTTVQFGAQFKFWGTDTYSTSQFPYMRGAEMLFIEAEAAYFNNDEATALKLINEINSARIDRYKASTASGEELYEEIKLAKRIELWGEGFSWFDMKRRGETMTRVSWVADDTSSGNWPARMTVGDYSPESHNGWRWSIPESELQYNTAINVTDLGYTE